MRSLRRTLSVLLLGAALACHDSPTGPAPIEYRRIEPEWVTGSAAASVDSTTGLFRLPEPETRYIDRSAAEALAMAVGNFLTDPMLGATDWLAEDRGGPLELGHLSPCPRRIYSRSPFGELPPPAPGWMRRSLASHWAIGLCGSDGTAQMSIGIPDAPADVRVVDGKLVFRQFGGGGDFDWVGVPARYPQGLPVPPEEAVAQAVQATGARVTEVPLSVNQFSRGAGQFPLCASWRVRLDRAVPAVRESDGSVVQVTELFVRHAPACYSDSTAFYVPSASQPSGHWLTFPRDTTTLANLTDRDSVFASFIGPTEFDRVRPQRTP